jgi:hypothetical protein
MNHINLDTQVEAVQQFLLNLSVTPGGTVLESKGKAVACIVPLTDKNDQPNYDWTSEKNQRRWELIDKKHSCGELTPEETNELSQLQDEMLRYRQQIAPLPLQDTQRLHDELLQQAVLNKVTIT